MESNLNKMPRIFIRPSLIKPSLDSDMVQLFSLFHLIFTYSKVLAMGFDEKFIRTWDYYFIYSAAGFKSRTLADYQVLLSGLACSHFG